MDPFAFDPPHLDHSQVAAIARQTYGLRGEFARLRGERSHNTLLTTATGDRFVLKIASASEDSATIEMHAAALVHLERTAPSLPVARMVPSTSGELVPIADLDGLAHSMRLVTHLPGHIYPDGSPVSPDGLRSIGALVGAVSAALTTFDHPNARHVMAWDIANGLLDDDELWAGLAPDAAALLAPIRPRLVGSLDVMATLPRQVIHNDGHGGNLLRDGPHSDLVTGIIDFGDLVHTVTVADLAVSAANLAPHQRDPIASLVALVDGFRSSRTLSGPELHALPELVLCRLALSTMLVDRQIATAPHIADEVGAERPGLLDNIDRWLGLDVDEIHDRLSVVA